MMNSPSCHRNQTGLGWALATGRRCDTAVMHSDTQIVWARRAGGGDMDLNRLFRYAVVAAGLSASLVMVPLVPAQATPASPGHSTTFAGYQDPTTTTKATASDSFVAPTLTCPSSSEQSGVPIGAGMVTSSTWDSGAVLVFGCNGTTPAYEAAFFVNGRLIAAHFIPNAGDVLHA